MMSYLFLTIVSTISLGLFYFLVKLISPNIAAIVVPFAGNIVIVLFMITYLLRTRTPVIPKRKIYIVYSFLAAIPLSGALIALYSAIAKGPMSVVMPIYGLSLLVTVVLGIIFMQEKISRTRLLGLICAVSAIILISL